MQPRVHQNACTHEPLEGNSVKDFVLLDRHIPQVQDVVSCASITPQPLVTSHESSRYSSRRNKRRQQIDGSLTDIPPTTLRQSVWNLVKPQLMPTLKSSLANCTNHGRQSPSCARGFHSRLLAPSLHELLQRLAIRAQSLTKGICVQNGDLHSCDPKNKHFASSLPCKILNDPSYLHCLIFRTT